jgi:hypothetical protein
MVPEIGDLGQSKLKAKILVIGAGGLPILQYITAGIGTRECRF